MGHTIAMTNQKGGVSKTTTALNLGFALARQGRRVLLVDLDPQSSLTLGLGASVSDPGDSLFGVIEAGDDIREIILDLSDAEDRPESENGRPERGERGTEERGSVHLAPAHISMSALDSRLKEEMGYHSFLADALAPVKPEYDFILVDCRPALDALETNAMYAADYLIIPVETNKYSLYATKDLGEFYQKVRSRLNPELEILGVLFTRVESRTRLSQEVIGRVSAVFGERIFETQIRKNVRLAEVPGAGDSIFDYAPSSHGAEDYMLLAQEVIRRVG